MVGDVLMKIQKGIVKYKDRNDIVCTYGTTDEGVNYYFLDDSRLSNGNIIASTELVEAIDPMYHASHVGVVDENGKIVIPFNHRLIRPVDDTILLAELATPVTTSVLEANEMKSNPALATKLVSTPALIKERLGHKMSGVGKYLLNDQFSDATIYDVNGNNLIDNEYYSFIVQDGGKLYFSKNNVDSDIREYSILPADVQEDAVVDNTSQEIDVSAVEVPTAMVEGALGNDVQPETPVEEKEELEEDTPMGEVKEEKEELEEEVIPFEEITEAPVEEKEVEVTSEEVPAEVSEEETPSVEEAPEEKQEEQPEEQPVEEPKEEVEKESEEKVGEKVEEKEEVPEDALKISFEDEENEDLDDLFKMPQEESTEEEEEDPLKDLAVETDFIEKEEDYDNHFELSNYENDSIVSDVAKYMDGLMKQNQGLMDQNKKLVDQNDKLKVTLEKVVASRTALLEKSSSQEKKIDALSTKIHGLEKTVSKLEKINREQEKIILSQTQDREDLEKVLSNVREVLGEDLYS